MCSSFINETFTQSYPSLNFTSSGWKSSKKIPTAEYWFWMGLDVCVLVGHDSVTWAVRHSTLPRIQPALRDVVRICQASLYRGVVRAPWVFQPRCTSWQCYLWSKTSPKYGMCCCSGLRNRGLELAAFQLHVSSCKLLAHGTTSISRVMEVGSDSGTGRTRDAIVQRSSSLCLWILDYAGKRKRLRWE